MLSITRLFPVHQHGGSCCTSRNHIVLRNVRLRTIVIIVSTNSTCKYYNMWIVYIAAKICATSVTYTYYRLPRTILDLVTKSNMYCGLCFLYGAIISGMCQIV